jgi:hypothetical protein
MVAPPLADRRFVSYYLGRAAGIRPLSISTNAMPTFSAPTIVRPGDATKPDPFTVLVVANPVLEMPFNSGNFGVDPIMANAAGFADCVVYVEQSLFATLPGQAEPMLSHPTVAPAVRLLSLFHAGLPPEPRFSFVAEDDQSDDLLVARRTAIRDFLLDEGIAADIVYGISGSLTHTRATAWFTSDDDTSPGVPFTIDGVLMHHRHRYLIPGTIGMHFSASAMTAAHEFQHAISSYSNGSIVDLYVDSPPGINNKRGRPIPALFAQHNAMSLDSDPNRGTLQYPPEWASYHCEMHDPEHPALMDNYYLAAGGVPEVCQNDKITRRFVFDRIVAKAGR